MMSALALLLLAASIHTAIADQTLDNCLAICETQQLNQDFCKLNCNDISNHNKPKSSFSSASVESSSYSIDDGCISISETSACAPWNTGYKINKTELSLVYGSKINSQADWDSLIVQATSGGSKQAVQWKEWAACGGYNGEPIQNARTYACISDIFQFSTGCNQKPPTPSLCPDTCDIYGKAVDALLKSPACPNVETLHSDPDRYAKVESRRTVLQSAAVSCRDILDAWGTGEFTGINSKQGFSSGGFGWDYKPNTYYKEETCPAGKFIAGVEDDAKYCGFAGNLKVAHAYCSDFPTAPCCQTLGSESHNAPKLVSSLKSALAAQSADGAIASTTTDKSILSIVGAIIGCFFILVFIVGSVLAYRRRRTHSRISSSEKAPEMTSTSSSSKKCIVVHDYQQSLPDELELRKGDVVIVPVGSIFDDDWARGKNVSTGNEGTFPMACVKISKE